MTGAGPRAPVRATIGTSGDRGTLVVGAAFFCVFGAWGAFLPFIAIYYRSLGYEASTIGWLTGLPLLVTIVATPAWGALADARHRHRAVLATTCAGATVAALLLASGDRVAWLLPMALVHAAFASAGPALIDSSALVALTGRHAEYGRLRLWGSVGWGVSAVVVGWLVATNGPRSIFVVYVVLMLACALCALRIPVGRRAASGDFVGQARVLAADRRLWAFLAMAFLGGTGLGAVNAYVPLHLDDLGARGLVGLAVVLAVVSEPPFMFLAGRLLRRFGAVEVFVAAYVLYAGRALALAVIDAPWFVVVLQLGHGPAYAVSWVAGVTLARRLAPEGLSATAQALFTSTAIGLGGAVGNVVGGALYSVDAAATFGFAAVVLGVGVPLVALTGGRGLRRAVPA